MEQHAILSIARQRGLINALRRFKILVDDQAIGHIGNGETRQFALPAGAHQVQVRMDYFSCPPLTVQLAAGQSVQLECGSSAQQDGQSGFSLEALGKSIKSVVEPGNSLYLRVAGQAKAPLAPAPAANKRPAAMKRPAPARPSSRRGKTIFISYRRQDSRAITGRVSDRLTSHFGAASVFRDVDSIPYGVDFRQHIQETISKSDLVIAIIGPQWLTITDGEGVRRLDKEDDFVRLEIESALQQEIPVIPLLVDDASEPKAEELPEPLRPFVFLNGLSIPPEPFFHAGMDLLIERIEGHGKPSGAAAAARFCTGCGQPLAASKFCTQCGRPTAGPA